MTASASFEACMEWAARLEWEDFPLPTRIRMVTILADNLAAAFSALDEPQVRKAREAVLSRVQSDEATVWDRGRSKARVTDAALLNALAMGWNELDEGYRRAVCHGGLYVLPALLAVAEQRGSSLREVLRAAILGYETVARIARTWSFPALIIHPHALLAPVGAAAGVAFLERLPVSTLSAAVAGACSLGMVGTMNQATQGVLIRNSWVAHAAVAGLNAVTLALAGVMGRSSTPDDVFRALGAIAAPEGLEFKKPFEFAVEHGYHKMNACCQYAHSAIEAVMNLRAAHPCLQDPAAIRAIDVEIHALALPLNSVAPDTTLGAKFSIPHAVAATLVYGTGESRAFGHESLSHPGVAALRPRVSMRLFEPVLPWPHDRPTRVSVTTVNGSVHSAVCWSARGGADHPFTDEDLQRKWDLLSSSIMPGFSRTVRRLKDAVLHDSQKDLAQPWGSYVNSFFEVREARSSRLA